MELIDYDDRESCNWQYVVVEVDESAGLTATSCRRATGGERLARRYFFLAATAWSPTARCSRTPPSGSRDRAPGPARTSVPTGTSMTTDAVTTVAGLVERAMRDALAGARGARRRLTMWVSVLMTSFEHERYIARALDGVLAQRGVDFELLVGDDASTDRTRRDRGVRPRASRLDPHLPPGAQPRQRGQGDLRRADRDGARRLPPRARRRRLLDRSRQAAPPGRLPRRAPRVLDSFHNVLCAYEGEARADEPYNGPDQPAEVEVAALLDRCVVASCSPMFRPETIPPLPPWYFDLPRGDWSLYFLAAEHGALRYLPDVMGVYRIHNAGMYSRLSRLEALERRTEFYAARGGARVRGSPPPQARRDLGQAVARAQPARAAPAALARAARVSPLSVPRVLRDRRRDRAGTSRSGLRSLRLAAEALVDVGQVHFASSPAAAGWRQSGA